jgi:hypothetical protein
MVRGASYNGYLEFTMSKSSPNPESRPSSNVIRIRHGVAAVVAQYIADLTRQPATA